MANSEAIAWYVEESQRLLEDQQRRAESLRTRGSQIAGFGALFLALIGGNAARILSESHGAGRPVIAAMLIAATLCLAVSIAVAVFGVNRPRSYAAIPSDEIANYLTEPFLDAPELWLVHIRSLRTLEEATENAQKGGNDALKWTTVSLYAFVVGLLFRRLRRNFDRGVDLNDQSEKSTFFGAASWCPARSDHRSDRLRGSGRPEVPKSR